MSHTMIDPCTACGYPHATPGCPPSVTPPLPQLDCPDWCERDHATTWAEQWKVLSRPYAIPMNDGTVSVSDGVTLQEFTADFLENLTHDRVVYRTHDELHREDRVEVALERDNNTRDAWLYVTASRPLNAAQAREFAAALVAAADQLEQVTT